MKHKIIVIGLDGLGPLLLGKLKERGLLPSLIKLADGGASQALLSTLPPNSAPAWTSFMTGKLPFKHGVFDFLRKEPGSYNLRVVMNPWINAGRIWNMLDSAGLSSAFVNFPVTYPPEKLNGIMISGMLSPGELSDFIYPADVSADLRRKLKGYIIDVLPAHYMKRGNLSGFIAKLSQMTLMRTEAALYCLEKKQWDFFMVLFLGLDRLQHCLWQALDSDYRAGYPDYIAEYFARLDLCIARILERISPDTNVIVVSDHGFGPLDMKIDLNNWLFLNGYLKFKKTKPVFSSAASLLRRFGLDRLKIRNIAGFFGLNFEDRIRDMAFSMIDWANTRAFACLSDAIFINLKGREKLGIVNSGGEYDDLMQEISSGLKGLRDPVSGAAILRGITRMDRQSGRANVIPDLLLSDYERRYLPVWSTSYREMGGPVFIPRGWQSGSHRREGILIGHGPAFKRNAASGNAVITDVLPTILSVLGIPVPEDLDGRVLSEILA